MRAERLQYILMYILLCGINLLYVIKYAPRYGYPPWGMAAAYAALFIVVVRLTRQAWFDRMFHSPRIYYVGLVIATAALTIVMHQFDPAALRGGRLPAIEDWLGHLLHGEFPYGSAIHPSGFPFLFILVLPFYLLGNAGWWQIVSFVLLGWVLQRRHMSTAASGLVLLLISPVFLYEVVVRSELFSNMVAVIVFLWLFERRHALTGNRSPFIWGLIGGLLLSTRGVVALVYAIYFTYVFRRDLPGALRFFTGAAISFVATILPFVVWNTHGFIHDGPLAVQSSYLPAGWIAALLIISLIFGWRTHIRNTVFSGIALILFTAVAIPFVTYLFDFGWATSVWQDKFDISYFCFCLPFVILAVSPRLRA